MSKVEAKIILAPKEVESTSVGQFFLKLGYNFAQHYDEVQRENYICVLDDFLPEVMSVPRLKSDRKSEKDYQHSYIDLGYLENAQISNLISRYFTDKNELDLIDRYSRKFKNIYSLKIQDYLNFGYFIDSVVVEAYKENFDLEKIRHYLNISLPFVFKLAEKQGSLLPIDISFSHDGNVFALQIQATVPDFKIKRDFISGLETLKDIFEKSNLFDLTYVESREKLTISSLWFKDEGLTNFHSRFYTVLVQRKYTERPSRAILGESNIEKTKYSPKKIEKISLDEKREIARKISIYTIRTHLRSKSEKSLGDSNLEDVKLYVDRYPNKKESKLIDDSGLEMVLELILASEKNFNEVDEAIQKIKSKEKGLIELAKKFTSEHEENEAIYTKTNNAIAELRAELIENHGEKPIEEIGHEELVEILSKKMGADKLEVRKVLSEDIEESSYEKYEEKDVTEKLEASAPTAPAEDKTTVIKEVTPLIVRDDNEIAKLSREKRDLEIKLEKMKDLNSKIMKTIEKLKENYTKQIQAPPTKTSGEASNFQPPPGHVVIGQADLLRFRKEIEKKEMAADKDRKLAMNKEKLFIKIKDDLEAALRKRDEKINQLEKRIEHSKEVLLVGQLNVLERQNKELQTKLEHTNKKLLTMSSMSSAKDHELSIKKEKEVEVLKNQIQTAQVLIEKFKNEKVGIEVKLKGEKELTKKLRDELDKVNKLDKVNSDSSENTMKDINLKKEMDQLRAQLMIEKKYSEEKLKNATGEIKKLELKNKMILGQLDEMNRKKGPSSQTPKSNENLIKQIEAVNSKMIEVSNDLTERKKENLKLKQENNLLTAKIIELERKLAQVEKKAA